MKMNLLSCFDPTGVLSEMPWWQMMLVAVFFSFITYFFVTRWVKGVEVNKRHLSEYQNYKTMAGKLTALTTVISRHLARMNEICTNDYYDRFGSVLSRSDLLIVYRSGYLEYLKTYDYLAKDYNAGMEKSKYIFCGVKTLPKGADETLPMRFEPDIVPLEYYPIIP